MISIVIVNWNTGELLGKCVQSLVDLPAADLALLGKVVVVDNASADASFTEARELVGDDRFEWVELRENVGFARGNNVGVAKLAGGSRDEDDILLLNPDTQVRPGLLVALQGVLDRKEKAGVVGPKLLEADGVSLQKSVRALPTLGVFVMLFLKLHRVLSEVSVWRKYISVDFDYKKEQEVGQVMGAAFLVRNAVWRDLKGLDEDFWIWFEEVDFCARALAGGWQVWYTPAGEVVHYGGVSFGKWRGFRKGLQWLKSCLMYGKKHLASWEYLLLVLLWPVAAVLVLLGGLWHSFKK